MAQSAMYHAFKPLATKIPNGWDIDVAQIQRDIRMEQKSDRWWPSDFAGKLKHYFTFSSLFRQSKPESMGFC